MEKKGIEIFKKGSAKEISVPQPVSITIGSTQVKTQGQPVSVKFEKQKACVYLVIDSSGSMAGQKLEQAKKGILDFARDAFLKEYQVGLISFDSSPRHICELTYDISALRKGLEQIQPMGSTNLTDAIMLAYNQLKKHSATRVIVIATDGEPDNEKDALSAGNIAKEDRIDIITIGTDNANNEFLKKLASRTDLANKVVNEKFSQAISDSVKFLPSPSGITKRK